MKAALTSGYCAPSNPADSHARCAGCGCTCHHPAPIVGAAPRGDVLTELVDAVKRFHAEQDALLEACTDPQALDMAELLESLQLAHKALGGIVRDVEVATAKAMPADDVRVGTMVVERHRGSDRKAWQHEDWQRDVRAKVLRAAGLAGAQGVLTAEGEVVEAGVLYDVLAAVQGVHGAAGPKVTGLRGLGLDARDYCETTAGAWHVKVTRMTEETATEGGQSDAA